MQHSHFSSAAERRSNPAHEIHISAEAIMQYLLDLNAGPQGTERSIADARVLLIRVKEQFEDDAAEDEGVAGYYRAEVPADLEERLAAACALGGFHSNFVVNWPDSFTFTVFDDETGEELKPDMVVDWVQLGRSCIDIEFLGDDDCASLHL